MKKHSILIFVVIVLVLLTSCAEVSITTEDKIDNSQQNLQVHFVDVGQGAAQIILSPRGKVIVIDAGNNDDEQLMVDYLHNLDVNKIDILIGTHPDADHIGGMDAVIDNFNIGKIYMPKISANTQTFESVLTSVQSKGLKISTADEVLEFGIEHEVYLNFLAPIGTSSDRNEMSAVVRLEYGNHSFLFTGDADDKSENEMIESREELKSTVLLVGHHGSSTSSTQAFLDKVKPEYAVIQSGEGNSYGHPTDEVLQRLDNVGAEIYRNDLQGDIIFTSDGQTMSVKTKADNNQAKEEIERQLTEIDSSIEGLRKNPDIEVHSVPLKSIEPHILASATVDNDNPSQNSTVTVTVKVVNENNIPVEGAVVDLKLNYKTTTTSFDDGVTNSNGIVSIPFEIGRASKGYTVDVDVNVQSDDLYTNTSTSFTPQ
ncbi:ComEC/Rec2 family competence protein [Chengkuizengella axinellae]|uniref:ComEC/Rec2 family competence protein n=1 Tax=Chengkuizengella axinellae TaxID=3064388 RepID=A0ABT9J3Y3_9BACL|nr:ComEC/Rec2 family competence protein [Chengkuizengella sp. 2205SS18-9]MDP5276193.1 ComEC/Rec2 family competence protein [Chengkuizengella sp. 2205SS18-9]